MAILAFAEANDWSQIYGICLMPVAIGFCAYSLWMYIKRAGMIRRKDPGPCKSLAILFPLLIIILIFVLAPVYR